jgi:hypothetical protein
VSAGAPAENRRDHVNEPGGVAVEGRAVIAFPFQVTLIVKADRAAPGLDRAGDLDFRSSLKRLQVLRA